MTVEDLRKLEPYASEFDYNALSLIKLSGTLIMSDDIIFLN